MNSRPAYAVLTRFGIIAAVLASLMFIASAASAQIASNCPAPDNGTLKCTYTENGEDPIARFTADDVEGEEVTWGVEGDDKDIFKISDAGVLEFKEAPNFEAKADADKDNTYKVTVTASSKAKGTFKVEVEVLDVNEAGKVTMNQPQPQVSRGFEAKLTDQDSGVKDDTWQWSRGPNVDGPWTDIAKATNKSRSPVADDVGNYLRATVTYTDKFGTGQTASGVSENPVEARTLSNAKPAFKDEDDTETGIQSVREVDENAKGANVGEPVAASDGDDDILLYTMGDPDTTDTTPTLAELEAMFSIDSRTGQIKTVKALDSNPDGADTDIGEKEWSVKVTATDPSGATGSTTAVITINNINDAPEFAKYAPTADTPQTSNPTALKVTEGTTGLDRTLDDATVDTPNYAATDDDDADTRTYAVTGADASKFYIDSTNGGNLEFCTTTNAAINDDDNCTAAHTPNFEKQSSYSISITATDNDADDPKVGKVDIKVEVDNAADNGKIEFSQRQPQVGRPVVATLSDPDGDISGVTWAWSGVVPDSDETCANTDNTFVAIADADSASYTPVAADDGKCLQATATYRDAFDTDTDETTVGKTEADVQVSDPANTAPKFADDQDLNTPGTQADAERSVAENDKGANVGNPVDASDADNATNGDLVMYTIGSTGDSASFSIGRDDGQITTAEELNFEVKASYTVVVTATDPSGATDTLNVNVTVTDADDKGVITGDKTFTIDENTTALGSYTATDEDPDDTEITWGVSGDDKDLFDISDAGVLAFKDDKKPNYESPADVGEDNIYKVTVTANKGEHAVEVTVEDVDEPGKVTLDQPQPQAGRTLNASGPGDPDAPVTDPTWQWSKSESADGPWTDIAKATSKSRTPAASDVGMYLRATVTYTDKHGEGKTASGVSENAVESRTLANAAPKFDDDDKTRSVNENAKDANVGDPVAASDADNDVLLYTLTDAQAQLTTNDDNNTATDVKTDGDSTKFTIDARTGQLKTKGSLDANPATGDNDAGDGTLNVRVTATDPSSASGFVDVAVTVKDINDTPAFASAAPKTLYVAEDVGTSGYSADLHTDEAGTTDLDSAAYVVTDDDTADTTFAYGVEGADAGKFSIVSDTGVLTVKSDHKPNYEKQKSYSITITASDNGTNNTAGDEDDAKATLDVTVKVTNVEDAGSVSLSAREPQINLPVSASFEDEDGGTKDVKWQWYWDVNRTASNVDLSTAPDACDDESDALCTITGANSPTYTPTVVKPGGSDNDSTADWRLMARVEYMDSIGTTKDYALLATEDPVQASDPANTAPKFADQDADTPGDQSDTATRSVKENADKGTSIGDVITAEDTDKLIYSLGGADAASFEVVNGLGYTHTGMQAGIGEITTAGKFDYETKSVYTIDLVATDPSGATDTITITVNVEDVDDAPTISTVPVVNSTPVFPADVSRTVGENLLSGTNVGDPVTATDANVGDTPTYTMSESMYFEIDAATGQITTTAVLDYETMASHTVTVTADDGNDENNTASVDVTIMVDNAQSGCNTLGNNAGLINDCEALLDSKSAFGATLNWSDQVAIADWDGVSVKGAAGMERVTRLAVRNAGLIGTIPAELGRLDALERLWLHGNELTGSIPAELGNLSSLEDMNLSRNELTGSIPAELNNLSSLMVLNLWGNKLTGEVPDLSGTSIMDRRLQNNDLMGGIPSWLSSASGLDRLHLGNNENLGGTIPGEMLNSTNIGILAVQNAGLTGEIPDLSGMTSLRSLNLRDNMLTGEVPDLSALDKLIYLRLHRNMLSGELPGSLGGLESLQRLWAHGNQFTGIGAGLEDAADTLTHLYLRENSFATGTCLAGMLADVANNDFADAGLAACPAPAPTTDDGDTTGGGDDTTTGGGNGGS